MSKFYVTAAIPYVNARPHIGYAMELVQGDAIVRFERARGKQVFYIYGADENSLKNVQAAEKEGISTQELCDRNAQAFLELGKLYNVAFDNFQRSSSPEHIASAQELWQRCAAAGDIYKKTYKGLYCVGCEAFYTPGELNEQGECLEHPGKPLEEVAEENYFFKLSKYQDKLRELIESDTYKIVPEHRKNEALGFINQGLQDFSISRSKERARGWGVPVPDDPEQIMYVWFDALNVYRSAAPDWWPANLHIIGKGIIRFHAVYWPAMLFSAQLALPKELLVHGYVTADGQKMSKTLGNVVDPLELVRQFGADPLRYYLLREIPTADDGDWSLEKFKTRYTADLANGLGNFASRVLTLGEQLGELTVRLHETPIEFLSVMKDIRTRSDAAIEKRKLHEALAVIWELISFGDKEMNDKKPWALTGETQRQVLIGLILLLHEAARLVAPFLPHTSEKIFECFTIHAGSTIERVKKPAAPLFPRL